MNPQSSTIVQVLKFGSSVLRTEGDLPDVAAEVHRRFRRGHRLVVVVSAFRGRTDRLVELADRLHAEDEDRATLLGLGEPEAAAATAIALRTAGLPARLIPASEVGIVAAGGAVDAHPILVDPIVIRAALDDGDIPVVPGYVARRRSGAPVVLGRGGSDLSAIALAAALGGEAVLLKGTGAVFEWDPSQSDPPPRRFVTLGFEDAIALGDRVIQPRALQHARDQAIDVTVTGLRGREVTIVHEGPTTLLDAVADDEVRDRPVRVAFLGLGTVGGGAAALLARHPDRCELVGALVRNLDGPRADLPRGLDLTTDPARLLDRAPEIVIESLGGITPADDLLRRAIESGADIVTANKTLIAARGSDLDRLAVARGRRILTSACVGGALPALELVRRARRRGAVVRIRGVLNGTSTFVLDRIAQGVEFDGAIDEARRRGYAESDVSADLGGGDAACKLALLARAIDVEGISPDTIRCDELDAAVADAIRGTTVRQVADLVIRDGLPTASVRLVPLDVGHPFAVGGVGNAISIQLADGEVVTARARGAGRWPTAHSIVADVDTLIDRRAGQVGLQSDEPRLVSVHTITPSSGIRP